MSLSWRRAVLALVGATAGLVLSPARAELQGRDLDGDASNGFEAYYDTLQDISWLSDANYFMTQLNAQGSDADRNALVQHIIDQVGVVDSHPLSATDFNTSSGAMSWWGAMAWAQSLTVQGIEGWRLPAILRPECMSSNSPSTGCANPSDLSELGHLYGTTLGNGDPLGDPNFPYVPLFPNRGGFTNVQVSYEIRYIELFPHVQFPFVLSDQYALQGPSGPGVFLSVWGGQCACSPEAPMFGWAVHTGDISAVPEAGTQALMALGLLMTGLAVRRSPTRIRAASASEALANPTPRAG